MNPMSQIFLTNLTSQIRLNLGNLMIPTSPTSQNQNSQALNLSQNQSQNLSLNPNLSLSLNPNQSLSPMNLARFRKAPIPMLATRLSARR